MMTTAVNPLLSLEALGQGVWLDHIERGFMARGKLARLIREDGISGVTSNPAIFERAMASDSAYAPEIAKLVRSGLTPREIYESLAVEDIRMAADALRDVYERTRGTDGFASLEVSPQLARDSQATLVEARRLWARIDRPNAMIKVPGTLEGLPAIRQLIADGVNVNVTLLFCAERYEQVFDAFQCGLEDRIARGHKVAALASVASFFVSRIDKFVDGNLEALGKIHALELRGEAAATCARLAYLAFKRLCEAPRWQALAARGARAQRLVWASTGTKNPGYSDVKYVEALIAAGTITTLPPETLAAYRDHGRPIARLEQGIKRARERMEQLRALGIDCDKVAQQLEEDGIRNFTSAFEKMLAAIAGMPKDRNRNGA